jgi:hypothetical protein
MKIQAFQTPISKAGTHDIAHLRPVDVPVIIAPRPPPDNRAGKRRGGFKSPLYMIA